EPSRRDAACPDSDCFQQVVEPYELFFTPKAAQSDTARFRVAHIHTAAARIQNCCNAERVSAATKPAGEKIAAAPAAAKSPAKAHAETSNPLGRRSLSHSAAPAAANSRGAGTMGNTRTNTPLLSVNAVATVARSPCAADTGTAVRKAASVRTTLSR